MQSYTFTDEVVGRLDDYARGTPPPPPVRHGLMHSEVHVPLGHLPIKIAQFAHLDPVAPHYHHWTIFVPTSPLPGVGHYYELVDESPVYRVQGTINDYHPLRGLERGSHTVGYVLPAMLPHLEAHLATVPVDTLRPSLSNQNWICDALLGLNHPCMFAIGITLEDMIIQMAIVSAVWELELKAE